MGYLSNLNWESSRGCEVVLAAVQNDGVALAYAAAELQSSREAWPCTKVVSQTNLSLVVKLQHVLICHRIFLIQNYFKETLFGSFTWNT